MTMMMTMDGQMIRIRMTEEIPTRRDLDLTLDKMVPPKMMRKQRTNHQRHRRDQHVLIGHKKLLMYLTASSQNNHCQRRREQMVGNNKCLATGRMNIVPRNHKSAISYRSAQRTKELVPLMTRWK